MSALEETLLGQIRLVGLPEPQREYRFWPGRRFAYDFAWPDRMLAVEVEGAIWAGGRHTSGAGFLRDADKYNEAALRGWKVLRVTSNHIQSGEALRLIERALGEERA